MLSQLASSTYGISVRPRDASEFRFGMRDMSCPVGVWSASADGTSVAVSWYRRQYSRRTEYRYAVAVSPGSGCARAWASVDSVHAYGHVPVGDRDRQALIILQAHTGLPLHTLLVMHAGGVYQDIPVNHAAVGLRACMNNLSRTSGRGRVCLIGRVMSMVARFGWKLSYRDMDRVVNQMTMDDLFQLNDKIHDSCRNLLTTEDLETFEDLDVAVGKWAQMALNQIPNWVD